MMWMTRTTRCILRGHDSSAETNRAVIYNDDRRRRRRVQIDFRQSKVIIGHIIGTCSKTIIFKIAILTHRRTQGVYSGQSPSRTPPNGHDACQRRIYEEREEYGG